MSGIIQLPRAFTIVIALQFDADDRDNDTLQRDVMRAVTIALDIAGNVKKVGVMPTVPVDAQGRPIT